MPQNILFRETVVGLTRFGVTIPAARLVLKGCHQQFHHGKVMSDPVYK